jgi:hypothetical protein
MNAVWSLLGYEVDETYNWGDDPNGDYAPDKVKARKHKMRQKDPPHPSVKKFGLVTLKDAMKFKSVIRQCNVIYADELLPPRVSWILDNIWFQRIVLLFIMINTITLGVAVDRPPDSASRETLYTMNNFFVYFFIVELILRFIGDGMNLFLHNAAVFDFILVSIGLLDIRLSQTGEQTTSTAGLRMVTATRFYRVGELVHSADLPALHNFISECKLMLRVVGNQLGAWYSVGTFMMYFFYMLGNFFTAEIGRDKRFTNSEEGHFPNQVYWGSLIRSMTTSMQVMTMDGWTKSLHRPYGEYHHFTWWEYGDVNYILYFFMFLIVVCNYGLLKVIVGTIVSHILQERKNDDAAIQRELDAQAATKQKFGDKVFKLLRRYYAAGASRVRMKDLDKMVVEHELIGTMDRWEINTFDVRNTIQQIPLEKDTKKPDMETVRKTVRKLFTLVGEAKSSEVFVIASKLRNCIKKVDHMAERIRLLVSHLEMLDERISPIDTGYHTELQRREDGVSWNNFHIKQDQTHKKVLANIEKFKVREKTEAEKRRDRAPRARLSSSPGSRGRSPGRRSRGSVGLGSQQGSRSSRQRQRSRERTSLRGSGAPAGYATVSVASFDESSNTEAGP